MLDQGKMDDALRSLSRWYDDHRLAPQEQESLLEMLNQLAGTVIYSREHLLEPAYEVQPGDTLDRIGERYKVPYQLLAKINAIDDPFRLRAGQKLKVMQGPFYAVVDLKSKQLTLVLDGRYAGRFPVGIGADQSTPDGELVVRDKISNPTYYGPERHGRCQRPGQPAGRALDRSGQSPGHPRHERRGQHRRGGIAGLHSPQRQRRRGRVRHPFGRLARDRPAVIVGSASADAVRWTFGRVAASAEADPTMLRGPTGPACAGVL